MTHTTMKSAINRLIKPLDKSAVISDGIDEWFPSALVEKEMDNTCIINLAIDEGHDIRELDQKGNPLAKEPIFEVLTPSSVQISKVEAWVQDNVPSALSAVYLVLDSPLICTRLAEGGEYMIWEDGEIPRNLTQALLGISEVLDEWNAETPGCFEMEAKALSSALPLTTINYGIGTFFLSPGDNMPPDGDISSLADVLGDVLRLAAISVKVLPKTSIMSGLRTYDVDALSPSVEKLVKEMTRDPQSPDIPILIRALQNVILGECNHL